MELLGLSLFLAFSLLAVVGGSDNLLSPKGVNYEVAALMSMKNRMGDTQKVLEGWDLDSVDPCTWPMIGCSSDGFVISLELTNKGLSGTLSPSIGNLSHLQTMLLQGNQLSGPVPSQVGILSQLTTLDLSSNQFIGEIPSSLGHLTRLNYLRLSRNKLSGQIPQPVADLSGLSFLDLSYNNFSGPSPKILAKDYSLAGNNLLCSSSFAQHCQAAAKPINSTTSPRKVRSHRQWVVSIFIGVSCTFVVSILLFACGVHWFKSRALYTSYVQQDYEFDIGNLRRFTFRELQTATNNFNPKNILGHGGFGIVYRGCLSNRTMIAVKRLKDPNFTGEIQFQTEVEMIGLALHRNILRLYGFCMTANERLLVYPYMPNGSVADRLRDTGFEEPSLNWNKRMRIAMGAARGFVYLHEQCNPKIIHRDVKAANILLDESYEAVVGDFGLAKLLDVRDSHVTTAVRGTVGHIAPEYLSTGQSSEKTDIFGFGIFILELITGRKPLRARNDQAQNGMILELVRTLYEEKKVEELVDRDLKKVFNAEELGKMVELALQCTQSNPNLRPKMSHVLKVIEGATGHFEDTPHGGNNNAISVGQGFSFSRNCSNYHLDSSSTIEAVELSGPR